MFIVYKDISVIVTMQQIQGYKRKFYSSRSDDLEFSMKGFYHNQQGISAKRLLHACWDVDQQNVTLMTLLWIVLL